MTQPQPSEWNNFDRATAHPANTTFYGDMYKSFFSKPIFLEAWDNDIKISQWLLRKKRNALNPLEISVTSMCSPQISNTYSEDREKIFREYVNFIRNSLKPKKITVLNYALVRNLTESMLKISGFTHIERYGTYTNDIRQSDEEMIKLFHDSHRNDTRKALRDGYEYNPELSIKQYFELSRETYSRSGERGPYLSDIQNIHRHLVCNGLGLFSGVLVNGKLQAASIILYQGNIAYYLHGASATVKARGATTFIHYENMKYLRRSEINYYDFGGARLETDNEKAQTISSFKAKFGGTLAEHHGGYIID
ncbi:MAG: peptidoglycan bridge formation glycyltransferase FemA/FemB family protein [Bacteroidota bacterium]|nr:peptidoglycan bridge formation glycyltransferase FemA/FemB family protein [Bacteroidota bacterium]